MNEYERENLVGMGRAAASWAMYKSDNYDGQDIILFYSIAEREHNATQSRRTLATHALKACWSERWSAVDGLDLRSGHLCVRCVRHRPRSQHERRRARRRERCVGCLAGVLLDCGVLAAIFVGGCCLYMARRTTARSLYTRLQGNLPTPKELNKSGYWEVEPDIWHNPINGRTLQGHAFIAEEALPPLPGRRTGPSESQQIRALYRSMKHNGQQGVLPGLSGEPAQGMRNKDGRFWWS